MIPLGGGAAALMRPRRVGYSRSLILRITDPSLFLSRP
jgi:hypothetical protein